MNEKFFIIFLCKNWAIDFIFTEFCTNIDIIVTFTHDNLKILESNTCENGCNGLEKTLKLFMFTTEHSQTH